MSLEEQLTLVDCEPRMGFYSEPQSIYFSHARPGGTAFIVPIRHGAIPTSAFTRFYSRRFRWQLPPYTRFELDHKQRMAARRRDLYIGRKQGIASYIVARVYSVRQYLVEQQAADAEFQWRLTYRKQRDAEFRRRDILANISWRALVHTRSAMKRRHQVNAHFEHRLQTIRRHYIARQYAAFARRRARQHMKNATLISHDNHGAVVRARKSRRDLTHRLRLMQRINNRLRDATERRQAYLEDVRSIGRMFGTDAVDAAMLRRTEHEVDSFLRSVELRHKEKEASKRHDQALNAIRHRGSLESLKAAEKQFTLALNRHYARTVLKHTQKHAETKHQEHLDEVVEKAHREEQKVLEARYRRLARQESQYPSRF